MKVKRYENGMLLIEPTGEAVIKINKDGLPEFEALVPCPFTSPENRDKEVREAINSVYMQGYFLTGQKLIRNIAFDKRREKTTTQVSFRACKNKDEATFVLGQVKRIVEAKI